VKNQKQVSIFFDFQSQHIASKEDMIKFFEEQQEKKRRTYDVSAKIKQSQEVNALLDKDYNTKSSPRKRQSDAMKADHLLTEQFAGGQSTQDQTGVKGASRGEPAARGQPTAPAKTKPQTESKNRGASLASSSTAVGKSTASTVKPLAPLFGNSKTPANTKNANPYKSGPAARR
jgi:hypothetical protein